MRVVMILIIGSIYGCNHCCYNFYEYLKKSSSLDDYPSELARIEGKILNIESITEIYLLDQKEIKFNE